MLIFVYIGNILHQSERRRLLNYFKFVCLQKLASFEMESKGDASVLVAHLELFSFANLLQLI